MNLKVLIIKSTICINFSNLFLEYVSTCFGQFLCPSSGVLHCTHSIGICHAGLLTAFSQAVSKPVWHIPMLRVQCKTPDDEQRNCPKHVEFYSKNTFEKLVHMVGFIIRLFAWSMESVMMLKRCSIIFTVMITMKKKMCMEWGHSNGSTSCEAPGCQIPHIISRDFHILISRPEYILTIKRLRGLCKIPWITLWYKALPGSLQHSWHIPNHSHYCFYKSRTCSTFLV